MMGRGEEIVLINLLNPIKAIKLRYLPLLSVYFAMGFSALSVVANTFFMKNNITLSASELISLGIWVGIPWSLKSIFGTIIDGWAVFGNNRKSYIYIGDILFLVSVIGTVDHASTQYLIHWLGQYGALTLTGVLQTTGIVVAQIVASTMAVEVIDSTKAVENGVFQPERLNEERGIIQVLTRISVVVGGLFAAFISGWLAANLPAAYVFGLAAICPLLSMASTFFVKLDTRASLGKINYPLFLTGLAYGAVCILCGVFLGESAQLIVFVISMIVISWMMGLTVRSMLPQVRYTFVTAMVAIFLFRTTPSPGPGLSWYYIDKLGFDPTFLGHLKIAESLTSLAVLWLSVEFMSKANTSKVLTWLTILITILSLPDLMVYYNWHEVIGISAKHLILVDSAAATAIAQLSMIPLGVIIANKAPEKERATYISLTASLMNIALVLGDLISKVLNDIFVVTREDFSQLGQLLIWTLVISTVLSLAGLGVLKMSKNT